MNINLFNGAFQFSINVNLDDCVEFISQAAGAAVYQVTKDTLDRAITDSQKVIEFGRQCREQVSKTQGEVKEVASELVEATQTRIEIQVEDKVILPMKEQVNKVITPVKRLEGHVINGLCDYLESTPVKKVALTESMPIDVKGWEDYPFVDLSPCIDPDTGILID